jgi:hypothetical protein
MFVEYTYICSQSDILFSCIVSSLLYSVMGPTEWDFKYHKGHLIPKLPPYANNVRTKYVLDIIKKFEEKTLKTETLLHKAWLSNTAKNVS